MEWAKSGINGGTKFAFFPESEWTRPPDCGSQPLLLPCESGKHAVGIHYQGTVPKSNWTIEGEVLEGCSAVGRVTGMAGRQALSAE